MEFDENKCQPDSNRFVLYQQVQEQSDICDVTIQVGEWKKQFHWCVLVISPFFENIRNNSFIEKQTGVIKLNIASPLSTETAILYLYGKQPKLTVDNVSAILELSEFLMIPNLKSSCVHYIKNMPITTYNCIHLLELSTLYVFSLPKCYEYIRGHLDDVLQEKEAVHLTKESVIELFTDPHLTYVSSEVRFSFLVNWSNHWHTNEVEFKEVFDCIDLDAMGKTFFEETLLQHQLVPTGFTKAPLDVSSEEHRVMIFSNSIQNNRLACFDIDREKWFGIATSSPENSDSSRANFSNTITWVRKLTFPEVYRVANGYSYCGVSIENVQSKQTSVIDISAEGKKEKMSCVFTDGDIFIGVDNKKIIMKQKNNAIESDPLEHNQRYRATVRYRRYPHDSHDLVRTSTFFYGRLESPKTELDPVLTIKGTAISVCSVNADQLVGLLSQTDKILYIYDIAACRIDTIQLKPYIDESACTYSDRKINLVPSDKGFIVYNMKHVVIVSRLYGSALAKHYVIQNVDLEYDKTWRLIKYLYCINDKTWVRLLRKTYEDKLEFTSVSHEQMVSKPWKELAWKPLPSTEELHQLSGAEHVFMVPMPRSLLHCHLSCPHCDALKAVRTTRTTGYLNTDRDDDDLYDDSDDDYTKYRNPFRASVYDDMASDDGYYNYSSD